jgi:mannose-6-phosphate isomerase-like protein (cupin superfamily)
MARADDEFRMPDGSRYILRTPSAQTSGDYVEFEWVFPAGAFAPPPHVHPSQVEEYEVLEGELAVMVHGEWRTLRASESASVPVGVNHTFGRPQGLVRVRNIHRPALGFEDFIARAHRVFAARGIRRAKDPRVPIVVAMAWKEHPETLQATRARDRMLMGAAAGMARLLRLDRAA